MMIFCVSDVSCVSGSPKLVIVYILGKWIHENIRRGRRECKVVFSKQDISLYNILVTSSIIASPYTIPVTSSVITSPYNIPLLSWWIHIICPWLDVDSNHCIFNLLLVSSYNIRVFLSSRTNAIVKIKGFSSIIEWPRYCVSKMNDKRTL